MAEFPNHCIRVVVTEKRVNRGAGFGLEIPVNYVIYRDSIIKTWIKKALEKLENSENIKVEKLLF